MPHSAASDLGLHSLPFNQDCLDVYSGGQMDIQILEVRLGVICELLGINKVHE